MMVTEYHPNTIGSPRCLCITQETIETTPQQGQKIIWRDQTCNSVVAELETKQPFNAPAGLFVNKAGFVFGYKTNDQWAFLLPGDELKTDDLHIKVYGQCNLPTQAINLNAVTITPQQVTQQAMVLAAGYATRLDPISGELTGLSKPALALTDNISVIQALLKHLHKFGINHFIVNTCFLPATIKQQLLALQSDFKISIIEEPYATGPAGGLLKAFNQGLIDLNQPILIAQGDAVTNFDIGALLNAHQERQAAVTIGGYTVPDDDVHKFGIIATETGTSGQITGFQEKPSLEEAGNNRFANTGFYVIDTTAFDLFCKAGQGRQANNQQYDFAKDFFPAVLTDPQHLFWAEKMEGHWIDIGSPEAYVGIKKLGLY